MNHLHLGQTIVLGFAALITASCAHEAITPVSRTLPERAPAVQSETLTLRGPADASPRVAAPTAPAPESLYFDWPVDRARMTRGFLPNKRRPHLGLDLAAPKGSAILASRGGTVIYRGQDFRGFGKMILIESSDGWATLYAHLDRFMVQEGQRVVTGELLGTMGRTGRATGVHLHFEIRKDRSPVDPLDWLPAGRELSRQARR